MDEKTTSRMKELINILNKASEAYYAKDDEIMSNFEYDKLYDELLALEKETGVVLTNSPTQHVGYASVDELPKERHAKPMLSLDKTKSREELRDWLQGHEALMSWKLDGLTVVLTYENGALQKAVTRGNGEVGEVITQNARVFQNIPLTIGFKGQLILRGEAVIHYSDFEKINEQLEEQAIREGNMANVRYKNPRNLCSGAVRQLNSAVTAARKVYFYAFALVSALEPETKISVDFKNSREEQFRFLAQQGFDVVEHHLVTEETIMDRISYYEEKIKTYDIPSDGLVLLLEDIAYGDSLGTTAKFPRNAIAFKWADDTQETVLRDVEWSASRTGLINPVAVFDPVELEGTTVRRASVHNVSIVKELQLGIGDHLMVYKANMIIPQIAENLTKSGTLEIPAKCPVCGGETKIVAENDTESLFCMNPECPAKKIKSFDLFVSRNAMNIDGLSEMTLEKFIGRGFIREFSDIYHLEDYEDEIVQMDGFGRKSYDKLIATIDNSRNTTARRLLTALGIPGVGSAGARLLCAHFHDDLDAIRNASIEDLSGIDGFGPVLAGNTRAYFADAGHSVEVDKLLKEVNIGADRTTAVLERTANGMPGASAAASSASAGSTAGAEGAVIANGETSPEGNAAGGEENSAAKAIAAVSGKTFVVTGSLAHYENRDALKDYIESLGGKVSGSVSKKTNYLINNDVNSTSSKNKKARDLNIPVISEEDFMRMCGLM
jgi:DNA ligase (NAD+)